MSKGLVLLSVFLTPAARSTAEVVSERRYTQDPRFQRIKAFFKSRNCPMHVYAADFVVAADQNRLDWRLLPSLALIESSGGKTARNNNAFGWDSAKLRFSTVRAGIHFVADRLANAPQYRGKNVDSKLKTYNPRPHYSVAVKRVMAQLAAEPI